MSGTIKLLKLWNIPVNWAIVRERGPSARTGMYPGVDRGGPAAQIEVEGSRNSHVMFAVMLLFPKRAVVGIVRVMLRTTV